MANSENGDNADKRDRYFDAGHTKPERIHWAITLQAESGDCYPGEIARRFNEDGIEIGRTITRLDTGEVLTHNSRGYANDRFGKEYRVLLPGEQA